MRTDQQIVDQTNDLARLCLLYIGTGYEVADDHKFYQAEDPRSCRAWQMACEIQEKLTATDPNDALSNLDAEPEPEAVPLKEYTVRLAASARVFNEETIMATSIEDAKEKASKINLEEYRWGYRYDHEDGIDGDQIAYVVEADDIEGDEVEVDLREAGEPFSWEACQIVKDMAKVAAKPDTTSRDEEILALLERARAACSKGE